MQDWPIIFSAPMVRALLDGSKTQTRRLPTGMWRNIEKAYYDGARPVLWVREALGFVESPSWDQPYPIYREEYPDGWDDVGNCVCRWRPSIHMPRWASRLTLEVTDVRRQRLQDISGIDAGAEGIESKPTSRGYRNPPGGVVSHSRFNERGDFYRLWNSLHAKPGTRWEDNPEVIAISFKVETRNIDAEGGMTIRGAEQ